MRRVVPLEPIRAAPSREVALRRQGVPEGHTVPPPVETLLDRALSIYESLTRPVGLMAEVPVDRFLEIFRGEGRNTLPAPLPGIVEQADGLAVFAATIGEEVGGKIQELFRENDPATACMLDGIASERTEAAADLLARMFLDALRERGTAGTGAGVLPYSPGYCGWHITGQRRLFAFLQPEEIGITLSESCLMTPIKSVSGVLVAGPPAIHEFDNDYEFCLDCTSWECRKRIASLADPSPMKS